MQQNEKGEMANAQDPNDGIDEQYNQLMNQYHQKLLDEYEQSPGLSEEDLWETRSPTW